MSIDFGTLLQILGGQKMFEQSWCILEQIWEVGTNKKNCTEFVHLLQ